MRIAKELAKARSLLSREFSVRAQHTACKVESTSTRHFERYQQGSAENTNSNRVPWVSSICTYSCCAYFPTMCALVSHPHILPSPSLCSKHTYSTLPNNIPLLNTRTDAGSRLLVFYCHKLHVYRHRLGPQQPKSVSSTSIPLGPLSSPLTFSMPPPEADILSRTLSHK